MCCTVEWYAIRLIKANLFKSCIQNNNKVTICRNSQYVRKDFEAINKVMKLFEFNGKLMFNRTYWY